MDQLTIYVYESSAAPWAAVVQSLVAVLSGVLLVTIGLLTYAHNVRVRAGDLLLKLEEAFGRLGSNLAFLEYKATCYDGYVQTILKRATDVPDSLDERQRRTLEDVDQCIRFLYICTLHAGETIPRKGKRSLTRFLSGFEGQPFRGQSARAEANASESASSAAATSRVHAARKATSLP
jgi:hypothetical protein